MRIGPMELTLMVAVAASQVVTWGLTIAALIDALKVPSDSEYRAGSKVVWVLVIVFLNCIGALIYYAVGRPKASY